VAAAPSRPLGLSLSYPSFSRRTPGSRDHGALDGNQKDIGPPRALRHGGCFLFKRTRASCRRSAQCAEVRSVAAAPSRLLGPRFRGGNERAGTRTSRRRSARCTGSVLWQRRHLGSWAPAFLPLVFPAKAGTQGPRSTGRQPKGHRAAKGSAARRVLLFKRAQAPRRWKAYCIEVRSVAAGPPRFLGPRFRGGNERAGTRTSCRRSAHCAEVRSVAATPSRPLGPRFCGGSGVGRAGSGRKTRGKGPSPVPVVHTICG